LIEEMRRIWRRSPAPADAMTGVCSRRGEEIAAPKDKHWGENPEATTRNACAFFGIERSLCHK